MNKNNHLHPVVPEPITDYSLLVNPHQHNTSIHLHQEEDEMTEQEAEEYMFGALGIPRDSSNELVAFR